MRKRSDFFTISERKLSTKWQWIFHMRQYDYDIQLNWEARRIVIWILIFPITVFKRIKNSQDFIILIKFSRIFFIQVYYFNKKTMPFLALFHLRAVVRWEVLMNEGWHKDAKLFIDLSYEKRLIKRQYSWLNNINKSHTLYICSSLVLLQKHT